MNLKEPAGGFGDHTPDDIEREMGLNGGVKEHARARRKFFISVPQDIGQWHLRKHLEGKPFISVEDLASTQPLTCLQKGFRVFSIEVLQLFHGQLMGSRKKVEPPGRSFSLTQVWVGLISFAPVR